MATTGFVSVTVQRGELSATMSLAEDVLVSNLGISIVEHDECKKVFGEELVGEALVKPMSHCWSASRPRSRRCRPCCAPQLSTASRSCSSSFPTP